MVWFQENFAAIRRREELHACRQGFFEGYVHVAGRRMVDWKKWKKTRARHAPSIYKIFLFTFLWKRIAAQTKMKATILPLRRRMGQQGRDLIEHRYIIILKFTVSWCFFFNNIINAHSEKIWEVWPFNSHLHFSRRHSLSCDLSTECQFTQHFYLIFIFSHIFCWNFFDKSDNISSI